MEEAKLLGKKKSTESSVNRAVWDCGSSLYDSFELKSLQKELDSALVSRTLSMPHLSDRRPPPPPANKKQASKISRSLQKLIRSIFRPKGRAKDSRYAEQPEKGFYVIYDRGPKMAEIPEFDELSPELRPLVRKSASARVTSATSLGITCS